MAQTSVGCPALGACVIYVQVDSVPAGVASETTSLYSQNFVLSADSVVTEVNVPQPAPLRALSVEGWAFSASSEVPTGSSEPGGTAAHAWDTVRTDWWHSCYGGDCTVSCTGQQFVQALAATTQTVGGLIYYPRPDQH